MALTQTHYRFRTDGNAVDATPSWDAAEDASPNPATTPFRLRLGLQGTSAASGEFELYAQKNTGSYAAITTSATDGIQSYDASSDADNTVLRVPRLTLSVDWQLAGAAIDLDFAGNRIYPSGAFSDYLSCSRASDGWAQNVAGTWVQFTSNQLRITDSGLLIEDARTNYLLNSGTPATQTTESLATGDYTLWVEGSGSALASGGTATITGASSATDGSPDAFTVTVAGTVTVTVTGTLTRFQHENGAFASSYIPTIGTSAVRAADLVTAIGSLNTVLSALPQTAFADATLATPGVDVDPGIIADGSNQDLTIIRAAHFYQADICNATNHLTVRNTPDFDFRNGVKIAIAQSAGARSIVVNGGTVASDANAGAAATNALIGRLASPAAGTTRWFGPIRRIVAWDSKVTDAAIQLLTTP